MQLKNKTDAHLVFELKSLRNREKAVVAEILLYLLEVDGVTGKRCSSRHALEINHMQPLALGGGDGISNLRLLCDAHNRFLWTTHQ